MLRTSLIQTPNELIVLLARTMCLSLLLFLLTGCSTGGGFDIQRPHTWSVTKPSAYTPAGLPPEAAADLEDCRDQAEWVDEAPRPSENAYRLAKEIIDQCMKDRGWEVATLKQAGRSELAGWRREWGGV